MPDVNIASGEGGGGGGKYVIFMGYCLYVPRVLARVVVRYATCCVSDTLFIDLKVPVDGSNMKLRYFCVLTAIENILSYAFL